MIVAGLFGVLYTIIKSLYIKYPPVKGYELTVENAPGIFETIEKARLKTNAPTLDKIIFMDGMDCGVAQNPMGFGRKSENLLFVGLYLLMLFTPEELESIFIHEFSHMFRKDTYISNKINRTIIRWGEIFENVQNRGIIAKMLLEGFAENYIAKIRCIITRIQRKRRFWRTGRRRNTAARKHMPGR